MRRGIHPCLSIFACALWVILTGSCASEDEAHEESEHLPCVSCHMSEFRSAHRRNPQPAECHVCHAPESWRPIVDRHRWPLTGAHANARCVQCHGGTPAAFAGTSTACVACHRTDYELRTFPAHHRYPTTCADCHTTRSWSPATFDPDEAASVVPESDAGMPVARDAGTQPHHASPSNVHATPREPIETTPASPATTPAPAPSEPVVATHPESRFPIATGHHAGIGCRTCHDQGGTMGRGNTDCVQCHSRQRYDDIHNFVSGYPQGSAPANFCVQCHHRGTRSRN